MGTDSVGRRRVRFGAFEVDLGTGELFKNGSVTRLSPQPCKILTLLVSRPGELVTREEIHEKVWGNDTFVDFENGLNFAIKRIRAVLGDDAESPRYIETLPKRGYRFIAAVEPVNGDQATPANGGGAAVAGPVAPPITSEPPARPRSSRRSSLMVAGVLLGLGALAFLLRPSLPSPRILRIIQMTNDGRLKPPYMVTGGGRLYFSEQIAGRYMVVALSAAGGEVVPIQAPFQDAQVLDVSRDGSELLLNKFGMDDPEGPIWAVPVLGGPPRRVGDLKGADAAWSPDGQEILYFKAGDHHLYVAKSDGTDSRALVKVPGDLDYIHWSPDGTRISVSVSDLNSHRLWEVSADGTNLHPVLAGWNFPMASFNGRWTFDGKYLLFDSYRGGPDNIWAIPQKASFFYKERTRPIQLTSGPLNVGAPVPSEDGKRIYVIGWTNDLRLQRYDSKSKTWKPFLKGISAEHVNFSRDGEWAAYISYPDANLYRSKVDGSQKLQLTVPPVLAAVPHISPDGKTVAYMARTPGKYWRIWLSSFGGGGSRRLTSSDFEETEPTWSPDSHSLAFCRNESATGQCTIELFDIETKQTSSLPPLANLWYPRWSPDGRYIAAIDGFQKVVSFDLGSRKWKVLFKSPLAHLYEPIWSRDGQSIYFVDYSAGYYRLRVRDHKIEKIVGSEGLNLWSVTGTFGGWHGLTPDGSLLELLDDGTREIYALEWQAP